MSNETDLLEQVSPKDEFTVMLEGMTKQELVKYARLTYGLSVTAAYTKPDLMEAIKNAKSKFAMNSDLMTGAQLDDDLPAGYAEIQLHRTDLTKKMKTAIVGLNGQMASLPIGTKFGCPVELLEILKNSIRVEYEQDTTTEPPELIEREVHAYPFTIFRLNPHTSETLAKSKQKWGLRVRQF